MKPGDLVRLKNYIHHMEGIYKPGQVGLVVAVIAAEPRDPREIVDVAFGDDLITCHWHELEVISES